MFPYRVYIWLFDDLAGTTLIHLSFICTVVWFPEQCWKNGQRFRWNQKHRSLLGCQVESKGSLFYNICGSPSIKIKHLLKGMFHYQFCLPKGVCVYIFTCSFMHVFIYLFIFIRKYILYIYIYISVHDTYLYIYMLNSYVYLCNTIPICRVFPSRCNRSR